MCGKRNNWLGNADFSWKVIIFQLCLAPVATKAALRKLGLNEIWISLFIGFEFKLLRCVYIVASSSSPSFFLFIWAAQNRHGINRKLLVGECENRWQTPLCALPIDHVSTVNAPEQLDHFFGCNKSVLCFYQQWHFYGATKYAGISSIPNKQHHSKTQMKATSIQQTARTQRKENKLLKQLTWASIVRHCSNAKWFLLKKKENVQHLCSKYA